MFVRSDDGTRDVEVAGGKYNLSDVSARLGPAQRAHRDELCAARARLAMHYFTCLECDDLLAPDLLPPRTNPGHGWNMFTMLLSLGDMAITLRRFTDAMQREGIGAVLSYETIQLPSFWRAKGWREGQLHVPERIGRETVTLPLFYEMTPGDVERVCEALCRIVRSRAA